MELKVSFMLYIKHSKYKIGESLCKAILDCVFLFAEETINQFMDVYELSPMIHVINV